jgi:hypothetical protein
LRCCVWDESGSCEVDGATLITQHFGLCSYGDESEDIRLDF